MNFPKFWLSAVFMASAAFLTIGSSCNKSSSDDASGNVSGNWKKVSQYNGQRRAHAVSFVIGDTAYVGLGFDNTTSLNNFFKYDVSADIWTRVADFPGVPRSFAVAFSIGTKAYVATGVDKEGNLLNDMWEYNQTTGAWRQLNPFGGSARVDAIAFAVNGKGYIGTGTDAINDQKDMWEYNPATDQWTEIGFAGDKRRGAAAFVYNNKAYVVTGANNGRGLDDFWEFDPASTGSNKWKRLNRISNAGTESFDDGYVDIVRENGAAFVMGAKAYVTTGATNAGGGLNPSTWEYDFQTDRWSKKTDFELQPREGAVGFSVKNRGIVGTGRAAGSSLYFDDFVEFEPNATKIDNDNY